MAGFFLVSDDEEKSAGLPGGEYDIPLVIQDRTFDNNNQLIYISGHPMERMTGFLGDRILVNGQPDFILQAATRPYRLRILNGSNSRIYRLAWQDGSPMTLIGTDGGMMGSGTVLPNGAGFPVLRIKVNRREKAGQILPQRLSTIERYRTEEAVNQGYPKIFELLMRHMAWTINGRTFQMKAVAPDERVKMNSMEIWEFVNRSGGRGMMGMMQMPHPIHLHGKQFQVLERQGVMHEGYVDEGWKDTVLLMPGERIRILVRFGDYPGLFLYHCHNLEHADRGMMRNYLVEGAGASA
jgi:FtsP/CotA-like multicopper oxidase with cupredoxin domain